MRAVVTAPGAEGDEKGLRRDVVRRALPEAAGGIAVDVRSVAVVEPGEDLGMLQRLRDDLGIVIGTGWWSGHIGSWGLGG